jgi:transposase
MSKPKTRPRYSPEVRERAVRMVLEHEGDYSSRWAAIESVAAKIGCEAHTLDQWIKQAERDNGARSGLTTDERAKLKALERQNREPR